MSKGLLEQWLEAEPSLKKEAKNITITQRVVFLASEVMKATGQANLSAFIEDLIRDEYERRHGVIRIPANLSTTGQEVPGGTIAGVVLSEEAQPASESQRPPSQDESQPGEEPPDRRKKK